VADEDKENSSNTTVKTVPIKLIPLWILIAINIVVISGSMIWNNLFSHISFFGTVVLVFALFMFNVAYLGIRIRKTPFNDL